MAIVEDIGRFLCGLIDSIAYFVLSKLYDLFNEISQLSLYSEEVVKGIGQRIGLVLGIFMLFRLAIALVSYIISPDTMKDSGKGTGKMIKSIIISLILLTTVNIIFKEAYKLQRKVIESKIVEKIFFGEQANVANIDISYLLYDAFLDPNPNVLAKCEDLFDLSKNLSDECDNNINNASLNAEAKNAINNDIRGKHSFVGLLSSYNALNAKKGSEYVFNYTPVVPTIAAIIAILILLGFCMDLATRIVKLLFLQIIAPIPIISNMAPGKGSDVFKNWYKQCINTYLSLFIRIIALNFGIFMIALIKTKFSDIFTGASPFITVLLIIGCLMFAKQVPKLLEEIMGIKMDGGMTLNPLKKFEEQALFGKNITGLAAGATVGTLGMLSGAGLFQGVKGGLSGLFGGKGLNETWKNQISSNRNMRTSLANGSSFWGRRHAQISNALGMRTPTDRDEARIKNIDDQLEDQENLLEIINRDLEPLKNEISVLDTLANLKSDMEKRAESKILEGDTIFSKDVIEAQSKVDTLKSSAGSLRQWVEDNAPSTATTAQKEALYQTKLADLNKQIADATANYNKKMKQSREQYISDVFSGNLRDASGAIKTDAAMNSKRDDYNEKIEANRNYASVSGLSIIDNTTDFSILDRQDVNITNSNQALKHATYPLERQKSDIENRQRDLRQRKKDIQTSDVYRRHQADKSAVGGK